jgi:hypothetical protein
MAELCSRDQQSSLNMSSDTHLARLAGSILLDSTHQLRGR